MSSNNSKSSNNIVRSHSPNPYRSSHRRGRPRRHTLPTALLQHHSLISHPYFSKHAHHPNISDDSIDTSSFDEGIVFYQNPNNGEIDYHWENELETCTSPSLMPENNEMLSFYEFSGDSLDTDEKIFQIMAQELSKQRSQHTGNGENLNLSPKEFVYPIETILEPTKDVNSCKEYIENDELDIDDLVKEMNELPFDQGLREQEEREEDPPSPLSPRDPEREGPALSEEEEITEDGRLYRLETDPEFQDEAGLETEDSGGSVWADDEGMDPMENQ